MNHVKKAWISIGLLAATLIINTLGALGYINGLSQKEISDKFVTLITPGPSTFSIWAVIYSLLIISVVVMLFKKDDPYVQRVVNEISLLFWLSCLLNIAWIVSFSYVQLEVSVLFIGALVLSLSLICMKLLQLQESRHYLFPLTFGLYTGWLFIATVVNIAATLVKIKWDGFGLAQDVWAIIMLIVAGTLVILVQLINKNAVFGLPVAWAFFGIYQFLSSPLGFNNEFRLLQVIALVGMTVLIGASAIQFYRNGFGIIPENSIQ